MTYEEQDRLVEILYYLYFINIPEIHTGTTTFWEAIKAICTIFKVNFIDVSKTIRILNASENLPQDHETYYLLNKLGLSVRAIRKISGIYWQKQKKLEALPPPTIKRRIVDPITKNSMRNFIKALYNFLGTFTSVNIDLLKGVI